MVMKNISDSKNQLTDIDYLLNEIQRDYPKYFREEFHTIVRSYNILEEYYEDLIKLKYLMWDEAINGFYKKYYHLEKDYYLKLKENLENSANNLSSKYHYVDMSHYLDSRFLQKCLNHS
ncbi:hypothetical protein KSF78_0008489 [Schistosoma japonicum]|nr:hypothetical protein KSF78_0008489 [Schistosoma japonicum]